METEEEEERQNVTKELQSSPYDERFGTDSRGNDRADRKLAASKYGVLERAKKNANMTTLVLAIYAERLLLVAVFTAVVVVRLRRTAVGIPALHLTSTFLQLRCNRGKVKEIF